MNPQTLVAIGASMGGVAALESLMGRLPDHVPPIVIVQHILPDFTPSLAARLDAISAVRVVEAAHGERLRPGTAFLAPARTHTLVRNVEGELRISLSAAPPLRFHRPSVDVLFHSLAALTETEIIAVLLTGMGRDGAEGLLALRELGARTIVQDEASSVIFGMPKEAIALGAAEHIVSLDRLPAALLAGVHSAATRSRTRTGTAATTRRE